MNTFSDVIDALSIAVAALIMGISESHVRVLKARDSIPPGYFKRIVDSEAGRVHGITFDLLYGLRDRRPVIQLEGTAPGGDLGSTQVVS